MKLSTQNIFDTGFKMKLQAYNSLLAFSTLRQTKDLQIKVF